MAQQVPIEKIKALRAETGAGIGECKSALQSAEGDLQGAKEFLRALAAQKAAKKADRPTPEGIVGSALTAAANRVALVGVRCETDFVSRNEAFQSAATELAEQLLAYDRGPSVGELKEKFEDRRLDLIQRMGENIQLGGYALFPAPRVELYVHQGGRHCTAVGFRALKGEQEAAAKAVVMGLASSEGTPKAMISREGAGLGGQIWMDAERVPPAEGSGFLEALAQVQALEGEALLEIIRKHQLEILGFVQVGLERAASGSQPEFASEVQQLVNRYGSGK